MNAISLGRNEKKVYTNFYVETVRVDNMVFVRKKTHVKQNFYKQKKILKINMNFF